MPASRQSIVDSAHREWAHWGSSTWDLATGRKAIGHTDDEPAFAQYVLDAYCSVGGGSPALVDIQDDRYFWSAVGMSAIMRGAVAATCSRAQSGNWRSLSAKKAWL